MCTMNVPLYDGRGLRIYRELMHREARAAADWHLNYGPEALQKSPDPELMVNLGKFSKFASAPMPLNVQRKHARSRNPSLCHELRFVMPISPIARSPAACDSSRAPEGGACPVRQHEAVREGHLPSIVGRPGLGDLGQNLWRSSVAFSAQEWHWRTAELRAPSSPRRQMDKEAVGRRPHPALSTGARSGFGGRAAESYWQLTRCRKAGWR